MKIICLICLWTACSITVSAQLKVDAYGRIGMGTNFPNPGYKLHVKGNLLLTTYPEIPPPNTVPVELRFKVGNGDPGTEIGTNIDKIAFWSSETGYNKIYAEQYFIQSDTTTKTNIKQIENGLDKIRELKSYSYNMKGDGEQIRYGFLAQEVEKIIPEIIDSARGIILIDYNQIIPILVSAENEQSKLIDSLKRELNSIRQDFVMCCKEMQNVVSSNSDDVLQMGQKNLSVPKLVSAATLMQNRPNPFTEKTIIEFEIIEEYRSALIGIFDMQGTLKKTIPITGNGKGQAIINGHELIAGMYLYSLIVDGQEIDTKKMILLD